MISKYPPVKQWHFSVWIPWRKNVWKEQNLVREYSQKIEEYIEEGYAPKLTPEETSLEGFRSWYLPDFPFQNPNNPWKNRIMFDDAANCNGSSLNDFLITGSDLLQYLVSIPWKFSQRKIGICGDMKDMSRDDPKKKIKAHKDSYGKILRNEILIRTRCKWWRLDLLLIRLRTIHQKSQR